ncbi:MAG: hypothetical protein IPK13_01780 [Deltaproteobacteria bacterium]|nr:hypothetical protein [Deltaproteobacteria bacterium]
MVNEAHDHDHDQDESQDLENDDAASLSRRNATVQALDARLSVWGHAAREAVDRRAEAIGRGAALYAERVGRNGEILRPVPLDARMALLSTETDVLVLLAANLIPEAVRTSARLLWVDPEKLCAHIARALEPAVEGARNEIRRRQALYRRRARLWADDAERLNRLREEVEALRVPRCNERTPPSMARALLIRHREEAKMAQEPPTPPAPRAKLRIRPGSITRWVDQLEQSISST